MPFGKKRSIGDYISDGFDVVSERVGSFTKNKVGYLLDTIEFRVMGLQDRIIKKFTYSFFFAVSAVFIALGAFYLLKEFFLLSNTISFLIVGFVMFVCGLFIKLSERRFMYYGKKNY